MFLVKDIRETRLYQEAMEEGEQKATARYIANLAAKHMPVEEIASALEVEIELVREVLRGRANESS